MLWEEYGGYLFTGYTTSSLRWHDFYLGFCMELGNLNMDVNLFVNLPPVGWEKTKGNLEVFIKE